MALKTLFITSLTSSETSAKDSLGDIRHEAGKRYKYVKFVVATVVLGDVVKYADPAGYDANEVQPLATQALAVAGVALATQAIDDFGWIQIGGQSGVLTIDGTGTPLIGSRAISSGTTKAFAQGAGEFAPCGTYLNITNSANRVLLNIPD